MISTLSRGKVDTNNSTCYIEAKPIKCYGCDHSSDEHLVLLGKELKRICMICGNQVNKRRKYGRSEEFNDRNSV